jgi:DNA repair exonuclease SbcCD nuclease subunit
VALSFIHTADFHLGADLRRFGAAASRVLQAQFTALERTLQAAQSDDCQFILICGDLFDSTAPHSSILERTAAVFDSYPEIPVLVLPGTHDYLSDKSVYHSRNLDWAPENARILNEQVSSPLCFHDFGCNVYFSPNRSNLSSQSPLAGLIKNGRSGFHIGLAHGSLDLGRLAQGRDFVIPDRDIKESGFDYLALGHWHKPRIDRLGQTTMAYPGIPQPLRFSDPATGYVNQVVLAEKTDPSVRQIPVSTVCLKKLTGRIYHPVNLKHRLAEEADPDKIVKLAFSYSDKCLERSELANIVQLWKSRYLKIMSEAEKDQTQQSSPPQFENDDANPLVQAYLDEIAKVAELEGPDRKHLYDLAAEIGVKLIQGGFDAVPSPD